MVTPRRSTAFILFAVLICLSLALPLVASASPLGADNASCSSGSNGCPPEDSVAQISVAPAGYLCAFAVQQSQTGKAKTLTLPGDRTITTGPGADVTLTNLDDLSKEVTLNITGAVRITDMGGGSVVIRTTGRSLLNDPEEGFVLAIGEWSWGRDANWNDYPLAGSGQLLDVCAMIASD